MDEWMWLLLPAGWKTHSSLSESQPDPSLWVDGFIRKRIVNKRRCLSRTEDAKGGTVNRPVSLDGGIGTGRRRGVHLLPVERRIRSVLVVADFVEDTVTKFGPLAQQSTT